MVAPKDKPEILNVRTAARSQHFHIEAVELRFSNGNERVFERLAGTPAAGTVIIVAVPRPGTVLLVREYAVGLDRYELSLPMGRREPGETVLATANRELAEETGYCAAHLERLHTLSLAPSILGYQAEIVLALDLSPAALQGDEAEVPEVLEWPLRKLDHVIESGEITEARTLAALFLARDRLEHRPRRKRRAVRVDV